MKKMHQRPIPRDELSTIRIRLLLKEEDVGLEPLFFHLQSLQSPIERSNFVRALLVPPVAVDRDLLEILRQTPLDKNTEESITVDVNISARDAGLTKTLQEMNAISGTTKKRIYIKRRLIFLFAIHGISPSAALILQYADQAMRQIATPGAAAEAIGLPNQPSLLAATTENTPILHSKNPSVQLGAIHQQNQHTALPPAFTSGDSVMSFAPIKTQSEEHTEEQKVSNKGTKNKKFKENAGFFGNIKK
ncbi:MAG: hypothetical protein PHF42_05225 [Pseudomonas sp.]|nr:hypothetical protein [Pseudomonas sp.]